MMVLSDGRKSFRIGLAVFIQYRSVTDTQPPTQPPSQPASHVAVAITLNALAKASSLKITIVTSNFQPTVFSTFSTRLIFGNVVKRPGDLDL